jgi:hypothetical protein
VTRACALKRYACLGEAASAEAGRASVIRDLAFFNSPLRSVLPSTNPHMSKNMGNRIIAKK